MKQRRVACWGYGFDPSQLGARPELLETTDAGEGSLRSCVRFQGATERIKELENIAVKLRTRRGPPGTRQPGDSELLAVEDEIRRRSPGDWPHDHAERREPPGGGRDARRVQLSIAASGIVGPGEGGPLQCARVFRRRFRAADRPAPGRGDRSAGAGRGARHDRPPRHHVPVGDAAQLEHGFARDIAAGVHRRRRPPQAADTALVRGHRPTGRLCKRGQPDACSFRCTPERDGRACRARRRTLSNCTSASDGERPSGRAPGPRSACCWRWPLSPFSGLYFLTICLASPTST